MKTIRLTGITKGLGKELFDQLTAKGYTVYGLLRDPEMATRLEQTIPANDNAINNAGIGGTAARLADVRSAEVLEPSESAARIIRCWEDDQLEALNGIVETAR